MSFDSTFDYTTIISNINTYIGTIDDKIDVFDAELQVLGKLMQI